MRMPDATTHNPDPVYLRSLIDAAGISQVAMARALGITAPQLRAYISTGTPRRRPTIPYVTQYAMEVIAEGGPHPAPFKELTHDPAVIRSLIERSGISQRKIAGVIGVNERSVRTYVADPDLPTASRPSHLVRYALEVLAARAEWAC